MAASTSNPKTGLHARSNSLPSRPNPIITQLDQHLCRLRASEGASTSSSLGDKLRALQDLHECVEKLLLLPLTQQAIDEHEKKWVDSLLNGSLLLLDLCNIAKDALLHTKERVHELQSILRRRGFSEIILTSEVKKYLVSRKVVKKAIQKALKVMQDKCTLPNSDRDHETTTMFGILKQVEEVSANVFETLLSFISGPKDKTTGWSLVSKLVHHKRVTSSDEKADGNEFGQVDAALLALVEHNKSKSDNILQIKDVQSQLGNLELCIQDLEDGLECLFRHLIKTRVSLLNILNH